MITDLVSPWQAAVEASEPARAEGAFRQAHAALLESLSRQRHPLGDRPFVPGRSRLATVQAVATDAALQSALEATQAAARGRGAEGTAEIVLMPGDGASARHEVLPHPAPTVVLLLRDDTGVAELAAALAQGLALLTRWRDPESASAVRPRAAPWDRWQLALEVPLAEWIYSEGVALHLAAELCPGLAVPRLLDVAPSQFQRLREREKALRALLRVDRERTGVGVVDRWLDWSGAASERGIPAGAGRFLAWRLADEWLRGREMRTALISSVPPA